MRHTNRWRAWPVFAATAAAVLGVALVVSLGLFADRSAQAVSAVLVGAGDIASCSSAGDEATAKLLDGIPGTVFTAGDNAYGSGTAAQFENC